VPSYLCGFQHCACADNHAFTLPQIVFIGDGENDSCLLQAAQHSFAFQPKVVVLAQLFTGEQAAQERLIQATTTAPI
jgi:phosphoserine phosphatase